MVSKKGGEEGGGRWQGKVLDALEAEPHPIKDHFRPSRDSESGELLGPTLSAHFSAEGKVKSQR